MVYTFCSIKEVIGRIIRSTGVQDMRMVKGMEEWIPEAMGLMKTRHALIRYWEDLDIEFHKAPLPCNIKSLSAVSYKGERLRYYLGSRSASESKRELKSNEDSVFQSRFSTLVSPEGNQVQTSLPVKVEDMRYGGHTYYVEGGWLNTSFSDGCVRIYYKSIPLDEDGLPLIPDNENYKQALYWYVRGAMIGAGHQDPVFKFDYCDMKSSTHRVRAVSEIKYSSPDQVESITEFTRLVTPQNYFEDFYGNPGKEQHPAI